MEEYSIVYKRLLNNLKILRKSNNQTQQKLGIALGISKQAYSSLESGKNTLSLKQLYSIAKHYSVSINSLLFEKF